MPLNLWYTAGRATVAIYARLVMDLDVSGREHIPVGPKLVVANHPSTGDPFYLSLLFRQPIDMLLIDSAFRVPLIGAYLRRAGQVCVTRGDGSAFAEARWRLEAGRSVAIFPEGNVSPGDNRSLPPRTGAARLALLTGVPVLPIGIYLPRERVRHVRSTIGRRPLNGHWYLCGPYAMTIGPSLRFEGDGGDEARVASATRAILNCITALAHDGEQRLRSRHHA